MKNFKSFKWGYGIVVSLVVGLSGCYVDGQNPQNLDYSTRGQIKAKANANVNANVKADDAAVKAKSTTKKYVSKDVTQKATPGPKQTAAPQLPVIQ